MNAEICQLSNEIIYGGCLKCADKNVRLQRLELPGFPENIAAASSSPAGVSSWLSRALDPENPVIFLNTDTETVPGAGFEELERRSGGGTGSIVNDTESNLVCVVVASLLSCGAAMSSVGVICPFRAQVRAQRGFGAHSKSAKQNVVSYRYYSLSLCSLISLTTARLSEIGNLKVSKSAPSTDTKDATSL